MTTSEHHTMDVPGGERTQPPLWLVIALGALLAISLVAVGSGSPRRALLALVGLGGLVGLGAIARFAPRRATDCLFVASVALVAIPIDSYLGYRDHVGGWPGIRISVSDLFIALLVPLALLGARLGRVRNAIPGPVIAIATLLLLQYAASTVDGARSDLGAFEIASTVHGFVLALIVAALLRRDHLGWVLGAIAVQVLIHSGFAVAQGVTGRPIGAGLLGARDLVLAEALEGGATLLRPAGLFAHPIVYATSLVVTLPLLAAAPFAHRSRTVALLSSIALVLGLAGLLLSLSRGAWISTIVAFTLLGALVLRHRLLSAERLRWILGSVLGVALVFGVAFGPRVYERLTRSDAGNVDVRLDLNAIAWRMTLANPLLGTGLNNFVETMEPFDPKNVMEYFPAPAHNLYLLEAAEAGLPALALWLALFGSTLAIAVRSLPRLGDRGSQWLVAALGAGIAGFLVSQLADFSHRLEPLRSLIWLLIGLLFGVVRLGRESARARREGSVSRGASPGAA